MPRPSYTRSTVVWSTGEQDDRWDTVSNSRHAPNNSCEYGRLMGTVVRKMVNIDCSTEEMKEEIDAQPLTERWQDEQATRYGSWGDYGSEFSIFVEPRRAVPTCVLTGEDAISWRRMERRCQASKGLQSRYGRTEYWLSADFSRSQNSRRNTVWRKRSLQRMRPKKRLKSWESNSRLR